MEKNNNKFRILSVIDVFVVCLASFSIANAAVSFDPPVNFPGGDGMRTAISVDLDGDGFLDLATADKSGGSTSVFINNGDGTFASRVSYPAGIFPFDITSGDFNGDGIPDLAVANSASNNVSVLINLGDGAFSAAINTPTGYEPNGLSAGDLNGNGFIDLAVANLASNTVSILSNNGNGTFSLTDTIVVGPQPISVVVDDLNGDGNNDIVALNNAIQHEFLTPPFIRHFSTVSVLLNNGDGTFTSQTTYEVNLNPFQVITADINSDGLPDIITANQVSNKWLSVLLNTGNGTFLPEIKAITESHQNTVAAADIDGDGVIDLLSTNLSVWNNFEVLLGNNDGTFAVSQTFRLGAMNGAASITTGDYDKDGDIDVVAASADSDMFGLYRNQLVVNPPVIVGTPDLIVDITKLRAKEKKGQTQLEYEFVISNIGDGSAFGNLGGIIGGTVYLSNDSILDIQADDKIKFIFVNTAGGLLVGASDKQKFKATFAGSLSGKYLFIQIDHSNVVTESDETNNIAVSQI